MLIVLTTFPDAEVARRIVRALVEERIIACGTLVPGVSSIYRWQGQVEESSEVMAILKCPDGGRVRCERELTSQHPYEVPEIVFIEPSAVHSAYARWVNESCA